MALTMAAESANAEAELEAALQEARDEGNGGDIDDPRVAQLAWLQTNGGA